jgi:4a-hydroxytetrahydrobiopterin dehydratase
MSDKEDLTKLKCVPCRGNEPTLEMNEAKDMLGEVEGWELHEEDEPHIEKEFKFDDFAGAMKFVNEVAELAEEEGHHPDICIHWNRVDLTLWTHAIGGLHKNDFIVAAKIDEIDI